MSLQRIRKSIGSPSLLAVAAVFKCGDGIPVSRQVQIVEGIGGHLFGASPGSGTMKCGGLVQPLLILMGELLLGDAFVQCGDFVFQVLRKSG